MNLTGKNYIGGRLSAESKETFQAVNPATTEALSVEFHNASVSELNEAIEKAEIAFNSYSRMSPVKIAEFLETAAAEIMNLGDALVERCTAETGLPIGRIQGERGRTVNQLKLFAQVVKEGSWVDARIDHAIPDRQPIPKPDVRSMLRPLGPVGIFGASNFPLAFSVAGGDTASALAAGCPVVVKGHPSHPGTSELVAQAFYTAIKKCSIPDGVFSMVQGNNHEVGMALVQHPLIKAIGFTGSYRGGKALFDLANQRPEPIPVYAEMGSTNPIFILPGALKDRQKEIAEGLTKSVNLGVGQFCTSPGLVFLSDAPVVVQFQEELNQQFQAVEAQVMLNQGISAAFERGVTQLESHGANLQTKGKTGDQGYRGTAHVFSTSAETFLANESLEEEVFGPSTITITADTKEQILEAAQRLGGHLTASLFATEEDLLEYSDLIPVLERKAGRLLINQFPTGVEVCPSMVHGGPFPATTDPKTTSVGTRAISRFARLVCYQNFPEELLPDALKEANPLGILRMVDSKYQ